MFDFSFLKTANYHLMFSLYQCLVGAFF